MPRRTKHGFRRQWVKCRECSWAGYYDYTPFGLGNPILTLGCGHGAAIRFSDAVHYITAKEAKALIRERTKTKERKLHPHGLRR